MEIKFFLEFRNTHDINYITMSQSNQIARSGTVGLGERPRACPGRGNLVAFLRKVCYNKKIITLIINSEKLQS